MAPLVSEPITRTAMSDASTTPGATAQEPKAEPARDLTLDNQLPRGAALFLAIGLIVGLIATSVSARSHAHRHAPKDFQGDAASFEIRDSKQQKIGAGELKISVEAYDPKDLTRTKDRSKPPALRLAGRGQSQGPKHSPRQLSFELRVNHDHGQQLLESRELELNAKGSRLVLCQGLKSWNTLSGRKQVETLAENGLRQQRDFGSRALTCWQAWLLTLLQPNEAPQDFPLIHSELPAKNAVGSDTASVERRGSSLQSTVKGQEQLCWDYQLRLKGRVIERLSLTQAAPHRIMLWERVGQFTWLRLELPTSAAKEPK